MKQKYIVVCGTREEFNKFIREKALEMFGAGNDSISLSDFIYASGDNLRGISNPRGFFIGTWRERPDAPNILLSLRMASHTPNLVLEKLWVETIDRNDV